MSEHADGGAERPRTLGALRASGYRIVDGGPARVTFEAAGDKDLRAFWRAAAERGVEVRSLARVLPTLEDAVVQAMEDARAG